MHLSLEAPTVSMALTCLRWAPASALGGESDARLSSQAGAERGTLHVAASERRGRL